MYVFKQKLDNWTALWKVCLSPNIHDSINYDFEIYSDLMNATKEFVFFRILTICVWSLHFNYCSCRGIHRNLSSSHEESNSKHVKAINSSAPFDRSTHEKIRISAWFLVSREVVFTASDGEKNRNANFRFSSASLINLIKREIYVKIDRGATRVERLLSFAFDGTQKIWIIAIRENR